MTECVADENLRWPCVTKGDETLPVCLSAFNLCAQFWEANERVELGDFAWPNKPIGFVLECTRAGWTAGKEQRWNLYGVDQAVEDGSAQWTLRVPTTSTGIQPITNVDASTPEGLDASVVVSENTKLLVDYIGGSRGQKYVVQFSFDIGGRQRVGSQEVHVAEK